MSYQFTVTGLGLKAGDGKMIMPGSRLVLKSAPPSHWLRFGHGDEMQSGPKEVEVATPAKESFEVATPSKAEDESELEELRAMYKEERGEEPDKRWKEKRLREELGLD